MSVSQKDKDDFWGYIQMLESLALNHDFDLAPNRFPGATNVFNEVRNMICENQK